MIAKSHARLELAEAETAEETQEVEQDIWTQLPPKHEIILNIPIQNQGRARPSLFVDWVETEE